ncbi:MAG: DUF2062 domain-containing protein [Hyphomicrobiales bacterium]
MLFRRRADPHFLEKIRVWAWPRRSWQRSYRYFSKRVLRLTASPHAVAAGFAAGVFASFTPFLGFHFVIAFALAYLIGGNFISAALGTSVGNPLTFPFIFASTFEVGSLILRTGHSAATTDLSPGMLTRSIDTILPLIKPMTVGAIPLGIAAALIAYFPIRSAVRAFQHARRERFAARARRAAEAEARAMGKTEARGP